MSSAEPEADLLDRARGGDDDAFRQLTEPYRRELLVHCYRILGSAHNAEDLLQETLVSAWRGLDRFDGRSLRAWLYRIATNLGLNELRDARRRPPAAAPAEPWWLEPFPDTLLPDPMPTPEARYESREAIGLAFIVALQHLPPRQRAALILTDVVGFSAAEAAHVLDTTPAAVNSALQRARRDFRPPRSRDATPAPRSPAEAAVVRSLVDAFESGDIPLLASLLTDDSRLAMPPEPTVVSGPAAIVAFLAQIGLWGQPVKLVPTHANGQPATAYYRQDLITHRFHAGGLLVLELQHEHICRITRFTRASMLDQFDLPAVLDQPGH